MSAVVYEHTTLLTLVKVTELGLYHSGGDKALDLVFCLRTSGQGQKD